jgi:GT2 family glycosyltransferase
MRQTTTTAIVVNYHSAHLTIEAVQSILDSDSIGPVTTIVVDNSCDCGQTDMLRSHLPKSVHLVINATNEGFGKACNRGWENRETDMILLLNPDACLLPGSLLRMQHTLLSNDRIGAIGPQIFWDPAKRFLLPPSYIPELLWFSPVISGFRTLNSTVSMGWRQFAIRTWRSKNPIRVWNLSGGHALLRRAAVTAAGGLFDPRFFLYYEDTDLFLRIRQAGYRLYVEPRAEVIHLFDQCGTRDLAEKRARMEPSYQAFMEKHTRGWRKVVWNRVQGIHRIEGFTSNLYKQYNSWFELQIPAPFPERWLFEWSPNPDFVPAAGCFGSGSSLRFGPECWKLLAPGRYFGRLGEISWPWKKQICISWTKEPMYDL